jgi:hypothetical protein
MRLSSLLNLAVVAAALSASACASIDVQTEYDDDVSFEGLTTFAWLPDPPPDMSSNRPTVRRIVRQAVERELEALGYMVDPFGVPDFWVNTYVTQGRTDSRVTWDLYGVGVGYWMAVWVVGSPLVYQEGTLLLDMLDRDRKVRWRGVATGTVEAGGQWAAQNAERVVGEAVSKMLADFPPDPVPTNGPDRQ